MQVLSLIDTFPSMRFDKTDVRDLCQKSFFIFAQDILATGMTFDIFHGSGIKRRFSNI